MPDEEGVPEHNRDTFREVPSQRRARRSFPLRPEVHADTAAEVPERARAVLDELETDLLGRPATMGRREVSHGAQVSLLSARKFWHALGFPLVADDDMMFTEADLTALSQVARLVREDVIDEEFALAMTRAMARTTDRLAVWQTQLMAETLAAPELEADLREKDSRSPPGIDVAEQACRRLAEMADDVEPLLVYAWRRHLAAAMSRMLADAASTEAEVRTVRVVGFADLVNFTSVVRRLSERQLAAMVQRFELLASDIVTAHGGRVIKTVGDEVLFVTVGAAPGAAVALDLVDAIAEDSLLPDVRVGLAYGPVLSRLGDVFGMTVNRASRLTAVAPRGGVLVDDNLAKQIAATSGFHMDVQRRRHLRGIGIVTPSLLRRSPGERRTGRGASAPHVDLAGDRSSEVPDGRPTQGGPPQGDPGQSRSTQGHPIEDDLNQSHPTDESARRTG